MSYREGQKVRIHFLQASKKQFPEGFADDVEILSLLLCRKCMRTFRPSRYTLHIAATVNATSTISKKRGRQKTIRSKNDAPDFHTMTVAELKSTLKEYGLKVKGNKNDLIDRCVTNKIALLAPMTVAELQVQLATRGLKKSGAKKELRVRLMEAMCTQSADQCELGEPPRKKRKKQFSGPGIVRLFYVKVACIKYRCYPFTQIPLRDLRRYQACTTRRNEVSKSIRMMMTNRIPRNLQQNPRFQIKGLIILTRRSKEIMMNLWTKMVI